jgi:hypothetical protein
MSLGVPIRTSPSFLLDRPGSEPLGRGRMGSQGNDDPDDLSSGQGPGGPRTGEWFERTFRTPKGAVDFLAETVVEGDTRILKDVVVYGRGPSVLTGLTKEALAARRQLVTEAKVWGFKMLRITGRRVLGSSSANPGHTIDITIDLTK